MQPALSIDQVVVIGTSTGGLPALCELLNYLPSDFSAPIFITMHIGDHPSLLADLLAKCTSLRVSFAGLDQQISPGHVYVAPPDRHLLIGRGTIKTSRSAKENYARPAIDPMFRSAAISYNSRTIGILLTGELDDGVVGLQAIKAYGGRVLVQDPDTAEAPSMPKSALRHVDVDACLPLLALAEALTRMVNQPSYDVDATQARIEPHATENDLTYSHSAAGAGALEQIGNVSGTCCPECGGALWELGLSPPRFRCHTGHSYTSATLLEAQSESVEEALWVAIRALHEKQLLLGRLAQSSKGAGRHQALHEYELASEGIESYKSTLRALLTSLRPVAI